MSAYKRMSVMHVYIHCVSCDTSMLLVVLISWNHDQCDCCKLCNVSDKLCIPDTMLCLIKGFKALLKSKVVCFSKIKGN